jgi:hypothetical protein
VGRDGLADQSPVFGQHLVVLGAEPLEQPRRALYVNEEERDRAARKLPHARHDARTPSALQGGYCLCRSAAGVLREAADGLEEIEADVW